MHSHWFPGKDVSTYNLSYMVGWLWSTWAFPLTPINASHLWTGMWMDCIPGILLIVVYGTRSIVHVLEWIVSEESVSKIMCMSMHVCMCMSTHVCMCMSMHVCMCMSMCVCINTCVHEHACMHEHVLVLYVYMSFLLDMHLSPSYLWTHAPTHTPLFWGVRVSFLTMSPPYITHITTVLATTVYIHEAALTTFRLLQTRPHFEAVTGTRWQYSALYWVGSHIVSQGLIT